MFNVKEEFIHSETEKLLYNIHILLEQQNDLLKSIISQEKNVPIVNINQVEKNAVTGDKRICKQCNEEFDNQGQLLTHVRQKHPKGGK
jgi:malonyl CoA-acyl carrier protein transacylase